MSQDTGIEWCHHTFNPWWGCQKISPGCLNCYADREATRHGFAGQFAAAAPHREFGDAYWKEPLKWARVAARDGIRRRAFCASMADVGEDHPIAEANRPRLWQLIEAAPELDWMLLTKRASTALKWLPERWLKDWPPHVWFGFSAEDQKRYDERLPFVLKVPAAIRFCSYEPALGGIDFRFPAVTRRTKPEGFDEWPPEKQAEVIQQAARAEHMARFQMIDLLIAGGESGPGARPANENWFRSARDQSVASRVAFHFKQWGEWAPAKPQAGGDLGGEMRASRVKLVPLDREPDGHARRDDSFMRLVGKKAAGRRLDGVLWDEMPLTPTEPRRSA